MGTIFSIVADINNEAASPQDQWDGPYLAFAVPGGTVNPNSIPDYKRLSGIVLNINDFVDGADYINSKLFAEIPA